MKKQITVKWTPADSIAFGSSKLPGALMAFQEPQPLLQEVGKAFSDKLFWRCPAVLDLCINTFVVRAPMDMTLSFAKQPDGSYSLFAPETNQAIINTFFVFRPDGTLSLPPNLILYCDEPLMMEVLPPLLLTPQLDNMTFIPATYDVGRWVRALEFAILPTDFTKPIVIERDAPLFCVRFLPRNGESVRFERVPMSAELRELVETSVNVKVLTPRLSLQKLYVLAKPVLDMFRKRTKK